MIRKCLRTGLIAVGLTAIALSPAAAQSEGQQTVGGFLGFTDRDSLDFTIGAEYEYHLDSMWSVGGVLEYTPDAYGGSDAATVLATGNYRPTARLKLTAGLGVEFRRFNDPMRFRLGAGYDVVQAPVRVTPRIAVDLGDGNNNAVVGVTFSRDF